MKLTVTHKTWRWRYCTRTLGPSRRFKLTIADDLLLVFCCNDLYSVIVAIVWTCFIFMEMIIIGHHLEGAYSMTRLSRSEQVFSREPWTLDVFWRGNFCPISLRGYAWLDKLTPGTLGGRREARTEERSSFSLFFTATRSPQSSPISINGCAWLNKRALETLGGHREACTHDRYKFFCLC